MNVMERNIIDAVGRAGTCSSAELLSLLSKSEPITKTTLYWYLNKLTGENRLVRVARGHYALSGKKSFVPEITDRMKTIGNLLQGELPFSTFCLWEGTELAPYLHNIAPNNVLYVETQRDSCESAFNVLKREGYEAFVRPDKELIYHYIDLADGPVFIKPLPSESPMQTAGGINVPKLEKILVDVRVDDDFYYLHGTESFYILRNAAEINVINKSTILRYARRRNIENELQKDLEDLGL